MEMGDNMYFGQSSEWSDFLHGCLTMYVCITIVASRFVASLEMSLVMEHDTTL